MSQMLPQTVLDWLWHQLEFNYVELARCYRECVTVLETWPSLRPRTDVYTSEQGHSDLLVLIYGPLPVQIGSNTYGIPIELWIPKQYPQGQPICYVRPTSQMRVSPGPTVDSNGKVYLDFGAYNSLGEILQAIARAFAERCPVYAVASQPPTPAPQPAPRPVRPAAPPTNIMDTDLPIAQLSLDSPLSTLVQQTADSLLNNESMVDLKAIESTREVLDYLEASLTKEIGELTASVAEYEASLRVLDEHTTAARKLVAKTHDPTMLASSEELVAPKSARAKQAVEAQALDAALGDTLQVLAQAFANERTDLGSFLRHTRQLARRQFAARVAGIKAT